MIHLFSKLAQIFSLLALCVVGILVALVFVQADLKELEAKEQTALQGGCVTDSMYSSVSNEPLRYRSLRQRIIQ